MSAEHDECLVRERAVDGADVQTGEATTAVGGHPADGGVGELCALRSLGGSEGGDRGREIYSQ